MARSLTIKNVPENIMDVLKLRARSHHRSLNGEALAILEDAMITSPTWTPRFDEALEMVHALRSRIKSPGLTMDEMEAAIHEGRQ